MRQLRTKFDDKLTIDAMLKAYSRAIAGKRSRLETQKFSANLFGNLFRIIDLLASEQYEPSNYRRFWVHDPKEREILALPFGDRVVHQWYIEEFIKPYYIPRFIKNSYACIPKRGTHRAVDRVQAYMQYMQNKYGRYYILKMDISKFFNSINPDILYDILARNIADPKLLRLTKTIIYDGDDHPGMPIGNYVSQYFANIYLNELDQYCKKELGIKCYVRYMDDFIALAPDKQTAKQWFNQIDNFVQTKLKLTLNRKSCYYPNSKGLDFAGYIIFENFRQLRRRSKRKLAIILADYEHQVDELSRTKQRLMSWYAHVRHANCHRFVKLRLDNRKYATIAAEVLAKNRKDTHGSHIH